MHGRGTFFPRARKFFAIARHPRPGASRLLRALAAGTPGLRRVVDWVSRGGHAAFGGQSFKFRQSLCHERRASGHLEHYPRIGLAVSVATTVTMVLMYRVHVLVAEPAAAT